MTAWRQVGALIGLRWRLVRSRPVKLGLLVGLATVPLLAWLIVAGSGAVEPEAYTAAITAAGAAYLGFGMLALIAPLTAGGGTELLPPDQLVAYPVRPATQFLASLVLAPLNLVWVVQLLVLVTETALLTRDAAHPWLGGVTTAGYVVACTATGQAIAWTAVGLRRTVAGRRFARGAVVTVSLAFLVIIRTGHGRDVVRRSWGPDVVAAVAAAGARDNRYWLAVTAAVFGVTAFAILAGSRACGWALRRPGDVGSDVASRIVRRRPEAPSALRALLAIDRASVWRAPALRRGALVLAVLPGLAAAGAGLPWRSLVVLPGLVAAGGGLLFGINAFCLDASGAIWLASLPHPPALVARSKALVTGETVLAGVALAVISGSVRAVGTPTLPDVTAILASAVTCCLLVVAVCLSCSVRRPHRADLVGPRDAVAPPVALVLASARLALPAALLGLVLEGAAQSGLAWLPAVLALPVAVLSARWIWLSLRRYDDPAVRSRIIQVVAAG